MHTSDYDGSERSECIKHYAELIEYIRIRERAMRMEHDILKQLRREIFTFMEQNDINCIIGESTKADVKPLSVNSIISAKALLADIGQERFLKVVDISIEKCKAHLTQQEFLKHTQAELIGQFRIQRIASVP